MIRGIMAPVGGSKLTLLWMSASHSLGGALGGLASFMSAWLIATPVRTFAPQVAAVVIVAGVTVWAITRDYGASALTSGGRQVAQGWMTKFSRPTAYLLYGVDLGTGFLTYAPYGAFFVILSSASLFLTFPQVLLAGVAYGLARTLLVGPFALVQQKTHASLENALEYAYEKLPNVSTALSVATFAIVVMS